MKIVCASEAGLDIRQQISEIFTDGFYQWLKYFSKDKTVLAKTFAHMFNLDVFYAALTDNNVMGIAALSNGSVPTICLSKNELQKHLGWMRGFMAYHVLKREFVDKQYPFAVTSGMACVEFVATAPAFQGRGVASAIITHFFTFPEYENYVLEVADTNTNAVNLYHKLGFKEFMRTEMKHKKQSGINNLLYMSYISSCNER